MKNTILVVDDDASVCGSLRQLFSNAGLEALTASSAEDALLIVREKKIDVIFLDLNLPEMNGIDLCRAIKKQNPVACCFAMTGHRSVFELVDCREAGFEDYFTKPTRFTQLLKAAEHAFERLERWKSL